MEAKTELQICTACGTQFDATPSRCRICDDPRQFVPPTGQTWTTLRDMRDKHHNEWAQDSLEKRMWSLTTSPKFAIGQRCILLETSEGNILWDCIALLDEETIAFIKAKGDLKAIVISHPHYYTTHLEWAREFNCPVYLADDDREWLSRDDPEDRRRFLKGEVTEIIPGVQAIKVGGHFPGSLVLLWDKKLFIADSFVTVPSAHSYYDQQPGVTSFVFMWSIPNMIPLPPAVLFRMWQSIAPHDFSAMHGAFLGTDVRDPQIKNRLLESMKIQARASGWTPSTCEILQLPAL